MSSNAIVKQAPSRVVSIAEERGGVAGRGAIANAGAEIQVVAAQRGLAVDGFFSTSARSLVALTYDTHTGQRYVLKAPALDARAVGNVMECYARTGVGPLSVLCKNGVIVSEYVEDNDSYFTPGSLDNFSAKRLLSRITECDYELDDDPIMFEEKMTRVLEDAQRRAEKYGNGDESVIYSLARDIEEVVELSRGVDGYVCHGDMHYKNVLRNNGRPLVIDPDPHLGPRETDVVALCSSLGVRHEGLVMEMGLDLEIAEIVRRIYDADREIYKMFRENSPEPSPVGQASRYLISDMARMIEDERSLF